MHIISTGGVQIIYIINTGGVQIPGSTYYILYRYQKNQNQSGFTGAREVSGSGASQAICKSAPHQHPTTQVFFTGRMPFLPPNQHRQSSEDKRVYLGYYACRVLSPLRNAHDAP